MYTIVVRRRPIVTMHANKVGKLDVFHSIVKAKNVLNPHTEITTVTTRW